jgi:hypothetical protein
LIDALRNHFLDLSVAFLVIGSIILKTEYKIKIKLIYSHDFSLWN